MFGRPDGRISRLTAQHRNQPTLGWLLQSFARRAQVARIVRPYLGLHLSTSGCSARRILVYAANKQGKNVACIVCVPCGSLWRRDGSVWRFRPLESDAGSLYICTQATGRTYTASCCGRNRFSRNPSPDGFLCSSEHSKVCIELLDTFRVTPENLALAGGRAVPPKSGSHKEETFGLHPCGGLCRATTKSISI